MQLLPVIQSDVETTLADLEKAFNIETVTKEFFDRYKSLYLKLVEALEAHLEVDSITQADFETKGVILADFSKRLLGQIVFLYFLQKKGWLGVAKGAEWGSGSKDFLQSLYRADYGKYSNFFNDMLEPLFYKALATERMDNFYKRFNCRIPFLNGGLFEPLKGYDWVNTDILLDNNIFAEIFTVFDLYNFTVREDEPLDREVAVDPEMLGKVFENLIPENERKGSGTFYTPREIVHYMCQESLINYLDSKLNIESRPIETDEQPSLIPDLAKTDLLTKYEDVYSPIVPREDISEFIYHGDVAQEHDTTAEVKNRNENYKGDYQHRIPETIRNHAQIIDEALTHVKICDPAIGSGAFPVGIMNEIVRARQSLNAYLGNEGRTLYDFKRNAIQESIYGVDIEPSAVDIAKLRLWLSLVVDEEDFGNIKPLPNLDYKIVVGNSLLGFPFNTEGRAQKLRDITPLKDEFLNTSSPGRKAELRTLINSIIKSEYNAPEMERSLGYKVSFDFRWSFFEVFDENGGFDIVIANPPYVKEYTDKSVFNNTRNSPYYQGKMDLWYFFGAIGLDILQPKGIECFIAPNNWITNAGASKLRTKIIDEAQIIQFVDFGNYKVFDTAGIQTMIYVLRKSTSKSQYGLEYRKLKEEKLSLNAITQFLYAENSAPDYDLYPVSITRADYRSGLINFITADIQLILDKVIKNEGVVFLDNNEVAQGIVAPQDFTNKKHQKTIPDIEIGEGIFVINEVERKAISWNDEEVNHLKPFYTTKQLGSYYGNPENNLWILYLRSDINQYIHKLPNIKGHLDNYKDVITSDFAPYGLHRSRNEDFFKGEKIISLRKCARPTFTYSEFNCYVSQTYFVIKTNRVCLKYLTGLLNSKLIAFWLKEKGKMQGNNYQVDKAPLLKIPILYKKNDTTLEIIKLVERLLREIPKLGKSDQNIAQLEEKIDRLIYQLYGLNPEDVAVIEDSVK